MTISGNPIDNVGTLTIEGNPTADGSAGPVVINSTIGTNVTALTIGTNTPAGTNVVTLSGTNLYTGTTTVGGTLILAATGSIAESTNIVIPAGGIVDVSAITNFTLSASNTLTALGRGTNVGDSGRSTECLTVEDREGLVMAAGIGSGVDGLTCSRKRRAAGFRRTRRS